MWYEGLNYVFVFDYVGIMFVYINFDLIGCNLMEFKDDDGVFIVVEMVWYVKFGGGMIDYM